MLDHAVRALQLGERFGRMVDPIRQLQHRVHHAPHVGPRGEQHRTVARSATDQPQRPRSRGDRKARAVQHGPRALRAMAGHENRHGV